MTIGPNTGSRCTPRMVSTPPVTYGGDEAAVDSRVRDGRPAGGDGLVEGRPGGGAVGDAKADAPDVALAHDAHGQHLEDDREAEVRRRLAGGPCVAGGNDRDPGCGHRPEGGEFVYRTGRQLGGCRDGRSRAPLPEGAREARERRDRAGRLLVHQYPGRLEVARVVRGAEPRYREVRCRVRGLALDPGAPGRPHERGTSPDRPLETHEASMVPVGCGKLDRLDEQGWGDIWLR